MADLTQTINESLNLFGGAPTNFWNSYNWNAFKWGEGTNTQIVDTDNLILESETLSDVMYLASEPYIEETISSTGDTSSRTLQDGSGYYYIFPSGVTNADNQSLASFVSGTTPSGTWTSASAGSTTWS